MLRLGARLALALFSSLCTLVFAEVLLRTISDIPSLEERMHSSPAMFLDSPYLQYRLRPNFRGRHQTAEFDVGIQLNRSGYRSPEFSRDKGERFRILCVGDSFTFGHGVEQPQAWPALLEGDLGPQRFEVINAGYQGGPDPDGYYVYLHHWGLDLKPDLVLVGLFLGNDLDDSSKEPRTQDRWVETDSDGLPVRIRPLFKGGTWKGYFVASQPGWRDSIPILRKSRLVEAFVRCRRHLREGRKSIAADAFDNHMIYQLPWSSRVEAKAVVLERLLVAMKRGCEQNGARLAVLLFPEARQLVGRPNSPGMAPQKRLRQILSRQGIAYLDLLPSLRAHQGAELYFPQDGHWTVAGNQAAEAEIERFLQRESLLPPPSGAKELRHRQ